MKSYFSTEFCKFIIIYTLAFIVVDVNNEKIGCSVGTEETLKEDGNTAKTMAHPTVLEAQYGVVKVIVLYIRGLIRRKKILVLKYKHIKVTIFFIWL